MPKKLLIFSSFLLIFLAVLEAGYLLFFTPEEQSVPEDSQAPLASPALLESGSINPQVFGFINSFDSTVLKSSVVNLHFEGTIVEIFKNPGVGQATAYEKGFVLRPLDPTANEVKNTLLFRATDLGALKVFQTVDSVREEIDFTELVVGDNVNIEIDVDLKEQVLFNRKRIEIIRR